MDLTSTDSPANLEKKQKFKKSQIERNKPQN